MQAYANLDRAAGRVAAERVITAAKTCPVREVARLGRTLNVSRTEFLARFDHPDVSNGPTENVNLKIKNTKRIARDYRSFDNYRLRLLRGPRTHPGRSSTDTDANPPTQLDYVDPVIPSLDRRPNRVRTHGRTSPGSLVSFAWFFTTIDDVPTHRLTQGISTILRARQLLKTIRSRCPKIDAAVTQVAGFARMIKDLAGDKDTLTAWTAAVDHDLPTLRSFTRGLRLDLGAVTAGLTLHYNSGEVEGAVNKSKAPKMQLFRRAKPDLLRKLILLS